MSGMPLPTPALQGSAPLTQPTSHRGSVGAAALTLSQRTCTALDDVPAGICTNAQVGRRLLDINGFPFLLQPFPQFTGGLNVFDSNDYSNYAGLQFVFKRRVHAGLGFQFGYTLSKSKTIARGIRR